MDGDQFRVSRSSSIGSPPREEIAAKRYASHLPFQVFCCESGTHVVDPAQSYYRGIKYRSSNKFHNLTNSDPPPVWDQSGECMDSSQAWFCRDMWVDSAKLGLKVADQPALKPDSVPVKVKLQNDPADDKEPAAPGVAGEPAVVAAAPEAAAAAAAADDAANPAPGGPLPPKPAARPADADANAGSDYDAMPGGSPPPLSEAQTDFDVPNAHFEPARIVVNPRCVTTYAGVSHAKLASDLFGPDKEDDVMEYDARKYVVGEWAAAPDSFVCQEQK